MIHGDSSQFQCIAYLETFSLKDIKNGGICRILLNGDKTLHTLDFFFKLLSLLTLYLVCQF